VIFVYHIPRTGGRSLEATILSGKFPHDFMGIWSQCSTDSHEFGDVYVDAWTNTPQPQSWLAWSHKVFDDVMLPPKTFTITMLRDPVQRFVSAYKLAWLTDGWIGPYLDYFYPYLKRDSLMDTARDMPPDVLCGQLRHFSAALSVDEAAGRIASLSFVMQLERFDDDVKRLSKYLGFNMTPQNIGNEFLRELLDLVDDESTLSNRAELAARLAPEYELFAKLREMEVIQ